MSFSLGIVLVALIVFSVVFMFSGNESSQTNSEANIVSNNLLVNGDSEPDKIFVVTGGRFSFIIDGEVNPDMVVNQGDLVRIEFINDDSMPHDWVIDEFDAATEIIRTGESSIIEFVADTSGEYEYYCTVGSHRAQGMYGRFIVL